MTDRSHDRGRLIAGAIDAHFGEMMRHDLPAFRRKFRKMAASPYAFYRGAACVFYADMAGTFADMSYLDTETSRVWIHGDLHAANFGTYMDAEGRLAFNVNDFDESYVGPYLWDLKRFAASLALIGQAKALSDRAISQLVTVFAIGYLAELRAMVQRPSASGAITLSSAHGPIRRVLQQAQLMTRTGMLAAHTEITDYRRRFIRDAHVFEVDAQAETELRAAFERYLDTLPPPRIAHATQAMIKDLMMIKGAGIGSAGLPSYNVLLEGRTEALENDIIIYLKLAQVPVVSAYVTDARIRDRFRHQGHRTAEAQRALQVHADPWVGWAELRGAGQYVAEVSPYEADLDWDELNEPAELTETVADLARIVARMHGAADVDSDDPLVGFSAERAILRVVNGDDEGFTLLLNEFAREYAAQARADHQLFVDLFRNDELPGLS